MKCFSGRFLIVGLLLPLLVRCHTSDVDSLQDSHSRYELKYTGMEQTLCGTTEELQAIWGVSNENFWVGGDWGTILHVQNGTCVKEQISKTKEKEFVDIDTIYAIWGTDEHHVWAAGSRGTVLFSTGHGDWSYTKVVDEKEYQPSFEFITGTSPSDVWVAGEDCLYHFDGQQWRKIRQIEKLGDIKGIVVPSPSLCYVMVQKPDRSIGVLEIDVLPMPMKNEVTISEVTISAGWGETAIMWQQGWSFSHNEKEDLLNLFVLVRDQVGVLSLGHVSYFNKAMTYQIDATYSFTPEKYAKLGTGFVDESGGYFLFDSSLPYVKGDQGSTDGVLTWDGNKTFKAQIYSGLQAVWHAPASPYAWGVGRGGSIVKIEPHPIKILRQNPGLFSAHSHLYSSTGDNDLWTAGQLWGVDRDQSANLISHFDGVQWTFWSRKKLSDAVGNSSDDLTVKSLWNSGPNDVYLGVFDSNNGSSVLHYDGLRWSRVPLPFVSGNETARIHGTAPSNVWIFLGGRIMHYDGATWDAVPLFLDTGSIPDWMISDVWAIDANEVWLLTNGSAGVNGKQETCVAPPYSYTTSCDFMNIVRYKKDVDVFSVVDTLTALTSGGGRFWGVLNKPPAYVYTSKDVFQRSQDTLYHPFANITEQVLSFTHTSTQKRDWAIQSMQGFREDDVWIAYSPVSRSARYGGLLQLPLHFDGSRWTMVKMPDVFSYGAADICNNRTISWFWPRNPNELWMMSTYGMAASVCKFDIHRL